MKKLLLTLSIFYFSISYSQNSDDFVTNGMTKQFQKNYNGALKDFDKAIELNPNNSEAYFCKGVLYQRMNSPTLAQFSMMNFNKAIQLNPKHVDAYLERGKEKYKLEDYRGAISDYNKAIEIDKDNYDCHANRGIAKIKLNDNDGALADFNKSIEINPEDYFAYAIRGLFKFNLGQKEAACLDFSKAGELGDKISYDNIKHYCN
ncbi:tetratricopeptide repeat protein [Flavobacterium sp.]|uniref:tetratricopeptide repeat protein n=1 Tax=Flavobacterium sp. TaxID=239 RepID=UPI002B4B2506|nr:tetratricopeptide repeat protein [Flavobacterium sp.]HLF52558.1 tetratricopeptide repeat protein [Flavobacterium sp.]